MGLDVRLLSMLEPQPVYDPVADERERLSNEASKLRIRDVTGAMAREDAVRPLLGEYGSATDQAQRKAIRNRISAIDYDRAAQMEADEAARAKGEREAAEAMDERQRERTERLMRALYGVRTYDQLRRRLPILQREFTPDELDDLPDEASFDPGFFQESDAYLDSVSVGAQGRSIPQEMAVSAVRAESRPERLVLVQGANGPEYVYASDAVGQAPAPAPRAPSAGRSSAGPTGSKTPPKYAVGPGGKIMKWVP